MQFLSREWLEKETKTLILNLIMKAKTTHGCGAEFKPSTTNEDIAVLSKVKCQETLKAWAMRVFAEWKAQSFSPSLTLIVCLHAA